MKRLIFILTFIPMTLGGYAQEQLAKEFVQYQKNTPVEKVYVQTSRESLTIGDTLYYSAYVLNGMDHRPSQLSAVLHVELISGSGRESSAQLPIDPLGRAHGDFTILERMPIGDYTLRAYTVHQLNFNEDYLFSKRIRVLPRSTSSEAKVTSPSKSSKVWLDLFPEGGDLIAGDYNFLAFKATDEWGRPIDLSGIIVDSAGVEQAQFETRHHGMGVTQLRPVVGQRYRALFEHRGRNYVKDLPEPLPSGYRLQVRHFKDRVMIIVQSEGVPMDNTFLFVQCRGDLIYTLKPQPGDSYLQNVIMRSELPSGILQLTFFDQEQKAVAERLIYNENPNDQTNLQLSTDQPTFAKRSKVSLEVNLSQGEESEPAMASLSTTVVPKRLFVSPKETIASYLLFTSDLKGSVHNPAYYLNQKNPKRDQHIDWLMMTHGWRRFDWEKVASGKVPKMEFAAETGIIVEGRVTRHGDRKKGVQSDLYLGFADDPQAQIANQSSEDGSFRFDGIEFNDTLLVYVRTLSDNEKKKAKGMVRANTFVTINDRPSPDAEVYTYPVDPIQAIDEAQIERGEKIFDIAAAFDENTVMLEEVVVADKREEVYDPFKSRQIIHSKPAIRIMMDSVEQPYTNALEYLYNAPGVQVIPAGNGPAQYAVAIRGAVNFGGNVAPLFLLDGFPVPLDVANNIPVQDVLFIDVLRGAEAAIYGSRGGGGVIAMYTRQGGEERFSRPTENIGVATFALPGFTAPRVFYAPNYDDPSEREMVRPDYRSTLYWNPQLQVQGGSADDTFFTSDESGEFVVYSEGIGVDGKIYVGSTSFEVR